MTLARSTGSREISPRCEHRPQPLDHLGGAHVVGDDVAHHGADLAQVGVGLGEQLQRRFRVAEDRGQRLAQLMRERARQLAEHGGAAEMNELLLLRAFLGLRPACDR